MPRQIRDPGYMSYAPVVFRALKNCLLNVIALSPVPKQAKFPPRRSPFPPLLHLSSPVIAGYLLQILLYPGQCPALPLANDLAIVVGSSASGMGLALLGQMADATINCIGK